MTDRDHQLEVATAAWQILQTSGGLVNRADIAKMLDVTPNRAWYLAQQRHFPDPVGEVGGRPVWLAAAVQAYTESPAPVGRPPKQQPDPPQQ